MACYAVAPGMKLSCTPVTVGQPATRPGSDAASVLAEIGLGGELDRLIREGIIAVDGVKADCWPGPVLSCTQKRNTLPP